MRLICRSFFFSLAAAALPFTTSGAVSAVLTGVPDYAWYGGCFGTASGNLMGYWDRHGFADFYTGPTAGGVAPLDSSGAHASIRSMWVSAAGVDGRPADQPGHEDDYYVGYESTAPDPYVTAGRPEHAPDCIGDFIGLSQNKWENLNGECDGNIDAFSFVFWDGNGDRRVNFIPPPQGSGPVTDIPSGLRAWTADRGYGANVFSQLTDFNPSVPAGHGFTFEDLKAEIDAGYPVLLYLQSYNEISRALPNMPKANPHMHGMLAYGYYVTDSGTKFVRYRTSWASGDAVLSAWGPQDWQAQLPVRGVIGFHPMPKLTGIRRGAQQVTMAWEGPSSTLSNLVTQTSIDVHWYVVERNDSLANTNGWTSVTAPSAERQASVADCCSSTTFFRIRVVAPPAGLPE